jgi:hypothetical protein
MIIACFYCEQSPYRDRDHIVPKSRGGSDEDWNRIHACKKCNSGKNDRLPSEWYASRGVRMPKRVAELERTALEAHKDRGLTVLPANARWLGSNENRLHSFTVKLPREWIAYMRQLAAEVPGLKLSDIARRAAAIGLDELKKRAR